MKLAFATLDRPGRWMSDDALARLSDELTALGRRCLDPLPAYQVFLGTRAAFTDKIIATARHRDGQLAAFCSCVVLPVSGVGSVLHLGLTCVDPSLRGARLSNALAWRILARVALARRLGFGDVWMTSVAAVLSVCGNLAKHFADTYPSPRRATPFAAEVDVIADAFDRDFRHVAYVRPEATFDRAAFVFRGSGRGTAFQKREDASEFHHRDRALNDFYRARLNFDDGDELLQVVRFRLVDLARYQLFGGRPA